MQKADTILPMRFLVILLMISLCGCGYLHKNFGRMAGMTTVSIGAKHVPSSGESFLPMVQMDMGVLVYAVNVANPSISGAYWLANETLSANWQIPNGNYHFYALGFSSASGLKCGDGGNVLLDGISQSINITITSYTCNIPRLQNPAYVNAGTSQPNPLSIAACVNGEAIQNDTSAGCGGGAVNIASIMITLPAYSGFNGSIDYTSINNGVNSPCIPVAGGALVATGGFLFPLGDGTAFPPLLTGIDAFASGTCSGPHYTYAFPNGLAAAGSGAPQFYFFNSGMPGPPNEIFPNPGPPPWAFLYNFAGTPDFYIQDGL